MKAYSLVLAALALFLIPEGANISGNILGRDGKPLVNAKVVYTHLDTGRKYTAKTDKKGDFVYAGVLAGYYDIVITDSEGQPIFSGKRNVRLLTENQIINDPTTENTLNVDLSTTLSSAQTVEGSESNQGTGKLSKEQLDLVRQENANAIKINHVIVQLHAALDVQDWPHATEFLTQLIALDPNRWEFYQNLGTIQSNLTHYQDAIQTFAKGAELAEQGLGHSVEPVKAKADLSNLLIGEGDAYNRMGKLDEAVALYTKAAAIAPQPETALYHACNAQSNNGRTAEAIDSCNQAIAVDPNQWEFYQVLADAQNVSGKKEDALQTYQKGIEAARKLAAAKLNAAKAKAGMGQMLNSEGNLYVELKKYDEAIGVFSEAAEVAVYPALPYFNLCATLYNIKHEQDAVTACDKAITSDPSLADSYFIKASILFGQGKQNEGKYAVPPGTRETLGKYLEYAPYGQHVQDVRSMLEQLDARIELTSKPSKK
jgi:tetratricopeptide (TPR) repeat protein